MEIRAKLQLKPGQRLAAVTETDVAPALTGLSAEAAGRPAAADAVIAFVLTRAALDTVALPAIEAARQDRLAWIAYPKARQLGTDLNRDSLAAALAGQGVQPVRQISIDDTWSALRFRPA
jgi:phage-related baseplate assembly protein